MSGDGTVFLHHEPANPGGFKLLGPYLLPEIRWNQAQRCTGIHNGRTNEDGVGERLKLDPTEEADVKNPAMKQFHIGHAMEIQPDPSRHAGHFRQRRQRLGTVVLS